VQGWRTQWWPNAVAKRASSLDAPLLEWATGALGALVLAVMLGVLVNAGLSDADAPPDVRTRVERILPVTDGYVVELIAENAGDQTAADVEIIAKLGADEARARFDYLPPHSERRGGVFFRNDPRAGDLTLRADGYADP